MNRFSIWHWLMVLLIIALIIGLRRIGSTPQISALLFSAQPAKTRREAEYIDDSLPRRHSLRIWLGVWALICGTGLFVLYLR